METKRINTSDHPDGLRTWIEVRTSAWKYNLSLIRSVLGDVQKMGVVKSNAYGHNLLESARVLVEDLGFEWLGVDSIVEGIALRKEGIRVPILVLGYTLPERVRDAEDYRLSLTVSSFEALQSVKDVAIPIHIKIDTGLHRQGFLPDQYEALISELTSPNLKCTVEGLYTHFADAKREEGDAYTAMQKKAFIEVQTLFAQHGISPIHIHADASPALIRHGITEGCTMVRLGAWMYGMWPSSQLKDDFDSDYDLRPSLSWKTIVSEVKRLKAGDAIGYGRKYTLSEDATIAICPIGYWHGYPSQLAQKGKVEIQGRLYDVVGAISMDMICVLIGDRDIVVGDQVVLISDDASSDISARALAIEAGISEHELLTRLNPRIERTFRS